MLEYDPDCVHRVDIGGPRNITGSQNRRGDMGRITKRAVEALTPGQRIADSEVRGFLVRRLQSGAASYAYRFRVKGSNKQRLISLGIHGTITAEKARELAKQEAGKVASGRDPK